MKMSYNNPTPVSIGIIPSSTPGHLLLIERTDGGLALPGGYVDELEDAAQAVTREVFEEMGIELEVPKWQLFLSSVTPDNKLLLFSYYLEPVTMPLNFSSNDEVLRVMSAPPDTPLKFPLHERAIKKWLAVASRMAGRIENS